MRVNYDVIVVGAGHAGCEAATAAARLGSKTLLITMDTNKIAQMSCNPAVGGIAKGQIVREIDALGGHMGVVSDQTAIQFRMLNRSKGPAMWSPRAQSDRQRFSEAWRMIVEQTENLSVWQDTVSEVLVKDGEVRGVRTFMGVEFVARAVVLTNGTFLNGLMHVGKLQFAGGRISEPASMGLTEQLRSLGFESDRMKTGTPMRVDARTIHFDLCEVQHGDEDFHKFSFLPGVSNKLLVQRPCHITYTNPEVHKILADSLDDSPLYNGQIQSIGPRYCPSIETKITTFAEKERHQLFLEPEGEHTTEYYINGFSSSLPYEVQDAAIRAIPALKDAHILRPGYAIEYDFFPPTQLKHTLETMLVKRLFFAGQINGTTGYEEAAGQGTVAGVNAHLVVHSPSDEFVLHRDEAYIGVLIDDLVTKGVDEPYRMFTSRAEYRILLRQDNADARLTPLAHKFGVCGAERMELLRQKESLIEDLVRLCHNTSVSPSEVDKLLEECGTTPLRHGCKLVDLVLRPTLSLKVLAQVIAPLSNAIASLPDDRREEIVEAAEIAMKYTGYIDRERELADKAKRLEHIKIRGHFDYDSIKSLSTEARQKLKKIDPETIGQASRIPGISPSDINILLVLIGR